jgi:hypothetical protein
MAKRIRSPQLWFPNPSWPVIVAGRVPSRVNTKSKDAGVTTTVAFALRAHWSRGASYDRKRNSRFNSSVYCGCPSPCRCSLD